eukprot:TCONS_00047749-protein
MVQEFNVVCCYSCQTYQVDQVKKSTNKWTCKMCQEKQTLKQVFFRGSGKDCRLQAQQRNLNRQRQTTQDEEAMLSKRDEEEEHDDFDETHDTYHQNYVKDPTQSRWNAFVNKEQSCDLDSEDAPPSVGFRGEYIGTKPRKRKSSSVNESKTNNHTENVQRKFFRSATSLDGRNHMQDSYGSKTDSPIETFPKPANTETSRSKFFRSHKTLKKPSTMNLNNEIAPNTSRQDGRYEFDYEKFWDDKKSTLESKQEGLTETSFLELQYGDENLLATECKTTTATKTCNDFKNPSKWSNFLTVEDEVDSDD